MDAKTRALMEPDVETVPVGRMRKEIADLKEREKKLVAAFKTALSSPDAGSQNWLFYMRNDFWNSYAEHHAAMGEG